MFEVITEYFPKSMPDTKPQIQEAQRIPHKINTKKKKKKVHIGMSYSNCGKTKDKEKILKEVGGEM